MQTEDICKHLRRLTITNGTADKVICWWNNKLQEISWSTEFLTACAAINKQSDLEQISAWCSLK